jgi:predicted RNA binding protein YcfA (HicA-like mRNA interferase family)
MPKLPRVSGAEALKALQRLGFEKTRQSGSHVIARNGARGCVIPMHSDLKVGTLAGLLRQAEVAPEDFIAALRGEA